MAAVLPALLVAQMRVAELALSILQPCIGGCDRMLSERQLKVFVQKPFKTRTLQIHPSDRAISSAPVQALGEDAATDHDRKGNGD